MAVHAHARTQVSASPDVSAFKLLPFCMHEKVNPLIKDLLCGHSYISIQDLVANTVYINILAADENKTLYFESPLAREDPNSIFGEQG